MQNHYSLLTRDPETDGVLDACAEAGIAFVPYFPLESGLLTGKYRAGAAAARGLPAGPLGSQAGQAFIDDDKLGSSSPGSTRGRRNATTPCSSWP